MRCPVLLACFLAICLVSNTAIAKTPDGSKDRAYWVQTLTHLADPVLTNLADGTLKKICLTSLCQKIEESSPILKL